MAQIETWRSTGGPPAGSGAAMPPWPYYGRPDLRAMENFGQTLAAEGGNWMQRHIQLKRNQELGALSVNLTKAWDDYQAWATQNPNEPDVELNEFKKRSEQWRADFLPSLQTQQGHEAGTQHFEEFLAEKGGDARQYALNRERTNALASFKGNVETLTNVPDTPFDLRDVADREESIGSAYWDAWEADLIGSQEAFLPNLKADVDKMWVHAILNAMKHSPLDVEPMLEASSLDAKDKRELANTWRIQQEHATIMSQKIAADRLKTNDRLWMARTMQTIRRVATPDQQVTPALTEKAMFDGEISEEGGRMTWDRLIKAQEPTREQRFAAYARVNRAWNNYNDGKIDTDQVDAVLRENESTLDEEDAESFIDKIQAGPQANTEYDALQIAAVKQVESIFDVWFPESTGFVKDEKDVTDRLIAEGDFAKRLQTWSRTAFPQRQKIDRNKFMEGAVNIVFQMQKERQAAQAVEKIALQKEKRRQETQAAKRPGLLTNLSESVFNQESPYIGFVPPLPPRPGEEPKTEDEFNRTVGSIPDEKAAREYYDRWKGKF